MLRVKLDDPAETWVYIDPAMSRVLSQVHRYSRVERWLYNGLHSLDFAFWYDRRPLWDVVMIVLLARWTHDEQPRPVSRHPPAAARGGTRGRDGRTRHTARGITLDSGFWIDRR